MKKWDKGAQATKSWDDCEVKPTQELGYNSKGVDAQGRIRK